MTIAERPAHRTAILWIRIGLGIFLGLMFLGQFSFYLPLALILEQPTTQPAPDPKAIPIFVFVLAFQAVVVVPVFLALQTFVPRWLRRRKSRFTTQAIWYVVLKIMAWMATDGLGFFALVCCLMFRQFWPFVLFSVLSMVLLAVNWPMARELRRVDAV